MILLQSPTPTPVPLTLASTIEETAIPVPVWIQLGVVCLFIVFATAVFFTLRWVIKTMRDMTKDNQAFLDQRDERSQKFFAELLDRQQNEFGERQKLLVEEFGERLKLFAEELKRHSGALERNTAALADLHQYVVNALAAMRASIPSSKKELKE